AGRPPPRDRRDPYPRLVALLARRPLSARPRPAELRQAAAAGLPRRPEAAGQMGRQRAAAVAATGSRAGDERAVLGGVSTHYREGAGDRMTPIADCGLRIADSTCGFPIRNPQSPIRNGCGVAR